MALNLASHVALGTTEIKNTVKCCVEVPGQGQEQLMQSISVCSLKNKKKLVIIDSKIGNPVEIASAIAPGWFFSCVRDDFECILCWNNVG